MNNDSPESNTLLAELGVSEQQERVYRLLLSRGALPAHQAAAALQLPPTQALAMLVELESHGLVTRAPGAELHFLPRSPEVAIEALILQRHARLERTRSAIAVLQRESDSTSQAVAGSAVEVVAGRGAMLRGLELVAASAHSELRCVTSAALIESGLVLAHRQALAAGARCLDVVDSGTAGGLAALEQLQAGAGPDDQYRCAPNLACAVLIADRQLAWLPLRLDGAEGQALLVRPSSLLDGLLAMFDMIWNQAATFHPVVQVESVTADSSSAFSSDLEALIPLLAAGLNDKAIAYRLRISVRTLIRRVAKLLTVLDARSRFQAGWATALRLHGLSAPTDTHAPLAAPEANSKGINGNHTLQRSAH